VDGEHPLSRDAKPLPFWQLNILTSSEMMQRTPEPEIMDGLDQCDAYAMADFTEVNTSFVEDALVTFADRPIRTLIDLGCGPADITVRLCRALPELRATAVDASQPMLEFGGRAVREAGLADRLMLHAAALPLPAPRLGFDAIISNSLLHHLGDPTVLWEEVLRQAHQVAEKPTTVHIMDLRRPESTDEAQRLVDHYAADEPEVLRTDFYNSLLAAYTREEVQAQLSASGLGHLRVTEPTDRHLTVSGVIHRVP